LAEETKSSSVVNNSDLSDSRGIFNPASFIYKNQNFNSYEEFKNKFTLFQTDKEKFWQQEIEKLSWIKPPTKIKSGKGINIKYFVGSRSNITVNCVDRHLTSDSKNKAAIIWESEPGKNWILTYQLLYSYMCRTANSIKKLGLNKRNKVCIICGSLPETMFSALACARLGITFTILNPNMPLDSLLKRFEIGKFDLIILADVFYRKGNLIDIKSKVDEALNRIRANTKKLIFRRIKSNEIKINSDVDYLISDLFEKVSDDCKPVALEYNFRLFSVFDYDENGNLFERFFNSSVFMVQNFTSARYAFDFNSDDIFWCNSDFSSLTGISYGIFAPLLHGISNFIYEGLPNFPSYDRIWKLISNYKITKLLTEDYIIKALMNLEDTSFNQNDIASLKMISICGNPISENDYEKIFSKVCHNKILLTTCFISELTATIIFSDIPGITEIYSGHINNDFPSIDLEILDNQNSHEKILCFKELFSTTEGNNPIGTLINFKNKKLISSNYSVSSEVNQIKILKRIDDKLLIAGELVCLKEIQKILEEHPKVKSCKIETKSDSILFIVPVAIIELNNSEDATLLLKEELRNFVELKISAAAKPIDVVFSN